MSINSNYHSLYKYPFGAVAKGTDVTVRMHAQKGDLQYARVLVRNTNTYRSDLYNMEKVSTITLHEEEVDIWEYLIYNSFLHPIRSFIALIINR